MGKSLTHKILESHLTDGELKTGEEIGIRVDQALIQDITGTMVMLNFEAMGLPRIRTKVAVAYGDHNVIQVDQRNTEDHIYLASSAKKLWNLVGQAIDGHRAPDSPRTLRGTRRGRAGRRQPYASLRRYRNDRDWCRRP